MSLKVSINGQLLDQDDAKISVLDHALLYGDGVFEGLRIYSGRVFRLAEHLDRLFESARAIALAIPFDQKWIGDEIYRTIQANGLDDGYVRLIVTRGCGTLGLDAHLCREPQVIVIAAKLALYPPQRYRDGMEIITASTVRNHAAALSPRIKSLNYLNNILAKMEGTRAGCDEALMLNHKGEVAECTGDNIFIVKRGLLITPPTDAGILEGITRNAVIELAAQLEIPCAEKTLVRHDIYVADECFLTGSAAEVISVTKIDGRPVGDGKPGKITQQLGEAFKQLVRQQG